MDRDDLDPPVLDAASRAAVFQATLERLRIQGRAPDGTTVTVTHTGAVVAVDCPGLPASVAEAILDACRDAHRQVATQVADLARADFGDATAEAFSAAWSTALGVH